MVLQSKQITFTHLMVDLLSISQTRARKAKANTSNSTKQVFAAIDELKGIIQYHDLTTQPIHCDIVALYKRSILTMAWTMLNSLGTMLIITVVFSQLFHMLNEYLPYLFSSLIAWRCFAQTTISTMHQTVWGGSLFHKIYLSRTTFAVAAIGTGKCKLIDFLLSMGT